MINKKNECWHFGNIWDEPENNTVLAKCRNCGRIDKYWNFNRGDKCNMKTKKICQYYGCKKRNIKLRTIKNKKSHNYGKSGLWCKDCFDWLSY